MILWNNLVIDVLPSFALALEPAGEDTMKDPPRPAGEPVLGRSTLKRIATQAALIAAVGLTTFYVLAPAFDLDGTSRQTMTFVAITAAQLLAVFNARTETGSGFVHATRNPFLWLALGSLSRSRQPRFGTSRTMRWTPSARAHPTNARRRERWARGAGDSYDGCHRGARRRPISPV
jgi:hypothetical protein